MKGLGHHFLRSYESGDGPGLYALVERVGLRATSPSQLERDCASESARVRLIFERLASGSELRGFVIARRVLDLLEIDLVGVEPGARRRGLARALLEASLASAGEEGVVTAQLELARSNRAALALYQRLGFVVVGRRARYYPGGEDALLLDLSLVG